MDKKTNVLKRIDWNEPVSDEEFEERMKFENDEISIDVVDFKCVNPRDIIDDILGKDFAK